MLSSFHEMLHFLRRCDVFLMRVQFIVLLTNWKPCLADQPGEGLDGSAGGADGWHGGRLSAGSLSYFKASNHNLNTQHGNCDLLKVSVNRESILGDSSWDSLFAISKDAVSGERLHIHRLSLEMGCQG